MALVEHMPVNWARMLAVLSSADDMWTKRRFTTQFMYNSTLTVDDVEQRLGPLNYSFQDFVYSLDENCPGGKMFDLSKPAKSVLGVVGIPACLLTVALNTLVLVAFAKRPEVRQGSNLYICNLALCDLGIALVCIPSMLLVGLTDCWPLDNVRTSDSTFCRWFIVIDWMMSPESATTMVLIAADRLMMMRLGAAYSVKVSEDMGR